MYKCIDGCVISVYNIRAGGTLMKQRDLIKKLEAGGFVFDHHGSNHDI